MPLNTRKSVHDLLRKVKLARLLAAVTDDLEERMGVAANILDEVETELGNIEMELEDD